MIEREEKSQHLAGIEPINSRVLVRRRVLYPSATTFAQKLNELEIEGAIQPSEKEFAVGSDNGFRVHFLKSFSIE